MINAPQRRDKPYMVYISISCFIKDINILYRKSAESQQFIRV